MKILEADPLKRGEKVSGGHPSLIYTLTSAHYSNVLAVVAVIVAYLCLVAL